MKEKLKERIMVALATLIPAAFFTAVAIVSCERGAWHRVTDGNEKTSDADADSARWIEFGRLGGGTYRDTAVVDGDTVYSTVREYPWGLVEEYKAHGFESVTITRYPK